MESDVLKKCTIDITASDRNTLVLLVNDPADLYTLATEPKVKQAIKHQYFKRFGMDEETRIQLRMIL